MKFLTSNGVIRLWNNMIAKLKASCITYDNAESLLDATDVQGAIDKMKSVVDKIDFSDGILKLVTAEKQAMSISANTTTTLTFYPSSYPEGYKAVCAIPLGTGNVNLPILSATVGSKQATLRVKNTSTSTISYSGQGVIFLFEKDTTATE